MNHEHPQDGLEPLPEHKQTGPEAEHVIRHTLARLTSLDAELRVAEGYLTFGAPFAAFLRLDDIAAEDPALLSRYLDVYADSWEHIDQLIDEELDGLGWREELQEFRKQSGIDAEFLDWNRPAFEAHLHKIYSIVQLDRWWHVFYR